MRLSGYVQTKAGSRRFGRKVTCDQGITRNRDGDPATMINRASAKRTRGGQVTEGESPLARFTFGH